MTQTTFIIAEAGVNHNGSMKLAKQLIDAAKQAGADAVKFQTFCAEELVCQHAPKAEYQNRATSAAESQFTMLKALELSQADQILLQEYSKSKNILFLSSPFDLLSADFLIKELQLPLIKIASGEITNLPLLFKVSKSRKKIILSTGMCTITDIEGALQVLAYGFLNPTAVSYPSLNEAEMAYFSEAGQFSLKEHVSLLHCTTDYPAAFKDVNLNAMQMMQQVFGLPTGYSDHTLGVSVAIAAVAKGASIIEKHFTLDKNLSGPDHQASLEPQELESLIKQIREVEEALGNYKKFPTEMEMKNRLIARKSLVALDTIQIGEALTLQNIGCKRPGSGISPMDITEWLNKPAKRVYQKDELIGS